MRRTGSDDAGPPDADSGEPTAPDDDGDGPPPVSARPGDGSLSRDEANKDAVVRRWDQATPSATLIGRAETADGDVPETLRRLHDERHPAMAGHAERMHRLDRVRIAHALCNALDLTPWERDRVLGVLAGLDLRAFGQHRGVARVALVTISHVVDRERRRRLGLHDREFVSDLDPDRMTDLYDEFRSITDEERFRALMDEHGLDKTSVNRLDRVLQEQVDERDLDGAALGRSPFRDRTLPDTGGT